MLTVTTWLVLTIGVAGGICAYKLYGVGRELLRDMVRAEVQAELERVSARSALFMVRPAPPSQRNVN